MTGKLEWPLYTQKRKKNVVHDTLIQYQFTEIFHFLLRNYICGLQKALNCAVYCYYQQ